jgi:hypothetical protein
VFACTRASTHARASLSANPDIHTQGYVYGKARRDVGRKRKTVREEREVAMRAHKCFSGGSLARLSSRPPPFSCLHRANLPDPSKRKQEARGVVLDVPRCFCPVSGLNYTGCCFRVRFFLLFSSRSAQQSIHCAPLPPLPQFPGSLAISIQRCRERLSGREVGDGGKKKEGFCAKLYAGLCAGIPLSIVAFRECIPACEKCTSRKRNVSRRRCTL